MATAERHDRPSLRATLRRLLVSEGASFEFARAVQLVERLASRAMVSIGELGPVAREPVRFTHDPAMGFPAGDIASIRERPALRGLSKLEITPTFLGLVGVASPLPNYLTEDLLERAEEAGDEVVFYDLLHHRLYSLFYRAWKKYRFPATARSDGTDPFTQRALAFVGIDAGALPDKGLSAAHLLPLAPLLAMRTRPARALRLLLSHSLGGLPVEVEGFIPRTVVVDEDQRARLGGANTQLGTSFTLGARVVDRAGRFRAIVGPVPQHVVDQLVPGGRHHARLRQVVDQFTRGILEAEVDVVLDDTGPTFCLGQARGGHLGVDTRLRRQSGRRTAVRFLLSEDVKRARTQVIEC